MQKRKRSLLRERISVYIFSLALLCAGFFICLIPWQSSLEYTKLSGGAVITLSDNWSVQGDGSLTPLDAPSRRNAGNENGTVRFVNTLPIRLPGGSYLCFQSKNESVRVWVDSTIVYSYGYTPQTVYGHGVGAIWHMAPLPANAEGKTVTVELTPAGGRTGLAPYTFLLGGRGDVIASLLRSKLNILVVSALMACIGLASLCLAFARRMGEKRRQACACLYFGMFVLLATLWNVTDSGLVQFVIGNKALIYMCFGCSFYLVLPPFILFMSVMMPRKRRLFQAMATISGLYGLIRIVLFVAGIVDFEWGLWFLHLQMALMIFVTNLVIWQPILKKKLPNNMAMCLAISAFTLVAGLALVRFYINDSLNVLRNGYSSGFYVGILLFAVIMVAGVLRNARAIRLRAIQADMLEKRAYTDELTGLYNARGFDEKCAVLLATLPKSVCCVVVDFDVNFFSQYNASNGLAAGDRLLQTLAESLRRFCRPGEVCARQEADHFVCLLCGTSLTDALERIEAVDRAGRGLMSKHMLLLSYGVTEVTDRSLPPAALRNQALVAKRTVKGNYERNLAVYDARLHKTQLWEMSLLSGFADALDNGEFVIFLQPKIAVATESLAGAEALVRRIEPDGSITSAGPIIEVLERKGFLAQLDYYVFDLVCRFQRRCINEGRPLVPISSNFSRVHLFDPDFADRVVETAARHSVPPHLLELELTESAFLVGKDAMQNMAQKMHAAGFKVSVDDFGSGYSSLNILKDVDVDTIKIDREFLADFAQNNRADIIIEHTIHLAKSMHITAVAEGIETAEQLAFLHRLGCDQVQGYFYSRPLPEDEFVKKYLS